MNRLLEHGGDMDHRYVYYDCILDSRFAKLIAIEGMAVDCHPKCISQDNDQFRSFRSYN